MTVCLSVCLCEWQSVSMNYEPGTCLIDEAISSSDIYGNGAVVSG